MGIKFSIFRKKNLIEQLENIETEIKELEVHSADTVQKHRKIARQLMVYSSGFCIVASVLLYFYFPLRVQNNLTLIGALILSPVVYYAVSRIISLYYNGKIRSSQTKLKDLKNEKKRLIDDIMNKETYKVAKDILEKYAPETLSNKYPPLVTKIIHQTPPNNLNRPSLLRGPIDEKLPNASGRVRTSPQFLSAIAPPNQVSRPPIFPQSQSYIERVFEYLIGEGPSSKYALICENCKTHNGMALMEEFEYTAFRCYSCKFLNPARKQRPIAPRLENDKSALENQPTDEESVSSSSLSDQDDFKIKEITNDNDKDIGNFDTYKSEVNEIATDENSLHFPNDGENKSDNLDNELCASSINGSNNTELKTENEDITKGTSSNSEEVLSESNLSENSHVLESR